MKPIITVDNLSKRYSIGALDAPYATLRETLTAMVRSPLKRFRRKGGGQIRYVGDAAFQKKCLGKMSDVARHGRTVLFVSHNMVAVKSLCNRAILLSAGSVAHDGAVDEVVNSYLRSTDKIGRTGIIPDDASRLGTGDAKLRSVRLTALSGKDVSELYLGQPFRVQLEFEVFKEMSEAIFELGIVATDAVHVIHSSNIDGGQPPISLPIGKHTVTVELHTVLLPRDYSFSVGLHHFNGTTVEWIERALDFSVMRVAETGSDSYRWPSVRGYVRPSANWVTANVSAATSSQDATNSAKDLLVGGKL